MFSIKYDLEDSFDFEGMHNAMFSFKDSVDAFDEKLKEFLADYLLLSNEGCEDAANAPTPILPAAFQSLCIIP